MYIKNTKIVAVSLTFEEIDFMKVRMLSPTKLLKSAIQQYNDDLSLDKNSVQLKMDLKFMGKHFNNSLKPDASKQDYLNQIERFLKKYPNWTKAQLLSRIENRTYDLEDA